MMRSILIFILCLVGIASAQESNPVITQISSTNLVEGEEATYTLIYRNEHPRTGPPQMIPIGKNQFIRRQNGTSTQIINSQRFYIYEYDISLLPAGRYTIPSLNLDINGKSAKSQEVQLHVMSKDSLTPHIAQYGEQEIKFFTKAFVDKTQLYPGESLQVELKAYIPRNMNPQSFQLPEATEVFNVTAWRFNTPNGRRDLGRVNMDGIGYYVGTYTTVLSAMKPGDATYGPIDMEVVLAPRTATSRFGFSQLRTQSLTLSDPGLTLEIIDFPSPPPASFDGAVGNFSITSELPAKTELTTNDSINATVSISGSGNLSELAAPALANPEAWKVIDVSKVEQGDERKQISGTVQFSYILQPLAAAHHLPRFQLTHFNVPSKSWKSDITQSLPVQIIESVVTSTSSAPAAVTEESMHDILGPLAQMNPGTTKKSKENPGFSLWSMQLIPAGILLLILVLRGVQSQTSKHAMPAEQSQALQELNSSQGADFIKAAANYANVWHSQSELAKELSKKRDEQCYTPGNTGTLGSEERKSILASLKKLGLILAFLGLTVPKADADAFSSWQDGDYQMALEQYQSQVSELPHSADLQYNLGCAHYRLGNHSAATKHFFAALLLDPKHYEAEKNLGFLQQQHASITAENSSEINPWLLGLSPERCLILASIFGWLSLITWALPWKLCHKPAPFPLISVMAGLALVAAGTWWIHPLRNAPEAIEPNTIVIQTSPLLTEPIQPSEENIARKTLISAKLASPALLITQVDNWAYIELANKSRGWIKADALGNTD